MNHSIENEEAMNAFPAEKYFDHYGWLNYIDSPYKDPEPAQSDDKVLDMDTTINVRDKLIWKSKRKVHKEVYHEAPTHVSPPTTPEPKRPIKSCAPPRHHAGEAPIQDSPITWPHKQVTKQPYTEEEEAWLDLFHAKLRAAIESGKKIKLPGAIPIAEAMNNFFASKQANDDEIKVEPRSVESITGKLRRSWLFQERQQLRSMLGGGKSGVSHVPSITAAEIEAYQREGLINDDTVSEGVDIDEGEEEVVHDEDSPERKKRRIAQDIHRQRLFLLS